MTIRSGRTASGLSDYLFEEGFRVDEAFPVASGKPACPHLDLLRRLFARHVECSQPPAAEGKLQGHGRFADAQGSPPSSTSDPLTMPPPSTRFTSVLPVSSRRWCTSSISPTGTGRVWARAKPGAGFSSPRLTTSSANVFHSPHAGHLPSHLGASYPQAVQKYAFFTFAIGGYAFGVCFDYRSFRLTAADCLRPVSRPGCPA